jgi:hypothetical protein
MAKPREEGFLGGIASGKLGSDVSTGLAPGLLSLAIPHSVLQKAHLFKAEELPGIQPRQFLGCITLQ